MIWLTIFLILGYGILGAIMKNTLKPKYHPTVFFLLGNAYAAVFYHIWGWLK